jgi:hypothetical protein
VPAIAPEVLSLVNAWVEPVAAPFDAVDPIVSRGAPDALVEIAERLDAPGLLARARKLAKARAAG